MQISLCLHGACVAWTQLFGRNLDQSSGGWVIELHSRGDLHALDNLCDSAGYVVARIGEFIHVMRVHPNSVGYCGPGAPDQPDHWTQTGALSPQLFMREALAQ